MIDHPLESGSDVLQAERHDFEAVDGVAGGEGYLVLIWWMPLDLNVSRVGIHEVEEFVTHCRIDHLVMLGSEELSLWQSLFKSVKSIQTPYFPFFFFTRAGLASQSG